MLDDPKFQKLVSVLFWSGTVVLLLLAALLFAGNFLGGTQSQKNATLPSDPLDKFSDVPKESVPMSFGAKNKAPSFALLPNRIPDELVAPAPIDISTEAEIVQSAQRFLAVWEDFPSPATSNPGEDYGSRLDTLVTEGGFGGILNRRDVSTWRALCPERPCSLGSVPAGTPNLIVADYDGANAYVVGYGVISVLPDDPDFHSKSGREFEQAYALLLEKDGSRWLVSRAAAETLEQLS